MSAANHDALLAALPALRRFAYYLTRDPQLANDLVQDCMVRAIARANQRDESASLRSWLFAILRNRHIDLTRRLKKKPDSDSLEERARALPAPDQYTTSGFLNDLSRAYQKLPADLREVMWLNGIQGLTYSESAEIIGIPVGTVRSRMFRAREVLRHDLQDYWTSGEVEEADDA